ncbi:MAG: enoyl-CoA hydratase/isomerase family protein [Tepidimonas sp.]|uniref:enoyl-CoA hydratase/isomerase family protein n=1 Tax=Tepidimonas sp. TaxID=2002775 RepID=UPI004054EF76
MAEPPVLFDTLPTASGHRFGRATLNAPARLNALSLPMVDLLTQQLRAWAQDASIAGVLLDAVGDKAFCAGGDVVGLYRAIRAQPPGQVPPEALAFFEREYRLDYAIHTYPKPIVCWGHGFVMGGGLGLMAGATHRVVTPRSCLAMPEISIGLYPDVGGSWLLPRLPGKTGAFLALTGAQLNAADALFAGLADFLCPHEAHADLLARIAASSWRGEYASDAAQLSHLLERLGAGADLPASALRTHFDRINAAIGHDGLEGIAPRLAALAHDPDPWLARAGATFAKGSPTSAALGLELQRRAKHRSLAEALRLELQASVGCCAHHDFAEGVRAMLVDKDKTPRWMPATLSEVTPDWIEDHLRPRFEGPHPLADLI